MRKQTRCVRRDTKCLRYNRLQQLAFPAALERFYSARIGELLHRKPKIPRLNAREDSNRKAVDDVLSAGSVLNSVLPFSSRRFAFCIDTRIR